MRYRHLREAPMTDFGIFGDTDKEGTLRQTDLRLAQNPKWQLRVRNAFSRTPFNFNVYLYNGPSGKLNLMPGSTWGTEKIDARDLNNLRRYAGLQPREFVRATLGYDPPDPTNSITVLLVENEGTERMPLTPWMLAHRIAHVIFYASQEGYRTVPELVRRDKIVTNAFDHFVNIASALYRKSTVYSKEAWDSRNAMVNELARNIATFRSGRMGKLANPGEFMVESFAQYLIKGRILFHHPVMDEKGRTPVEGEEKRLLKLCRDNELMNDREGFVHFVMINEPEYRPFFKNKPPRTKWLVYYTNGELRTEVENEMRAEHYRERGYNVVEKRPARSTLRKWQPFLDREAALTNMWNSWLERGLLRPTLTDQMDDVLDRTAKIFEKQFDLMLKTCVGWAFVL